MRSSRSRMSIPEALLPAGLREPDVPDGRRGDEASRSRSSRLATRDDLAERLAIVLSTTLWDLHADQATIHGLLLSRKGPTSRVTRYDGVDLALSRPLEASEGETRFSPLRVPSERVGAERVGTPGVERKDWHGLAGHYRSPTNSRSAGITCSRRSASNERVPNPTSSLPTNIDAAQPHRGWWRKCRRTRATDLRRENRRSRRVPRSPCTRSSCCRRRRRSRPRDARSMARSARRVVGGLGTRRGRARLPSRDRTFDHDGRLLFQRLVDRDMLDSEAVGRVWEIHMAHRQGLVGGVDRALTSLLLRHPASASPRIMGAVRESRTASLGYFASSDLALLSQLAAVTSASEVWEQIANWPEIELRWALHHMDWRGDAPEPLVREFLCSKRLEEVANEASVCFFNTLGVVSGRSTADSRRNLNAPSNGAWHSKEPRQRIGPTSWSKGTSSRSSGIVAATQRTIFA